MIRQLIEKRRNKKLKIEIINRVDTNIEDLLNDFTKNMSEKDTLITVSQLRSLVNYKKSIMHDL